MELQIRPFTPDDYPAIGWLFNTAYVDAEGVPVVPDWPEEQQEQDAQRPDYCKSDRLVVEHDGQIVAVGEYDQTSHRYHPRKFWFDLYVHPDYQRQGIGTTMYDRIMGDLMQHDPLSVRQVLREDLTAGMEFLLKRGWREESRLWESKLDVATANLAPFADAEARLAGSGIVIKTYPELADDPQRDHKLYELAWEIRQDLPDLDAATKESFEVWHERRLNQKNQLWDAFFVAVDGDRYAGYLYHAGKDDDPGYMKISQLGVARDYRGRGVARALKLREVLYAQQHGYHTIHTTNESNNQPILSINQRLGFARRPAWVNLVKVFDTTEQ